MGNAGPEVSLWVIVTKIYAYVAFDTESLYIFPNGCILMVRINTER
jgi:hypothetical protein